MLLVKDLPPLDPHALITAKERETLVGEYNTADGCRTALALAVAALNDFLVVNLGSAADGKCPDYFGDGKTKDATQVRCGGRVPAIVSERRTQLRAAQAVALEGGRGAPAPAPADLSPGTIAQANALRTAQRETQAAYGVAGHALNVRINILSRREICYKDECADVFGDGLMKLVTKCYWPSGISTYEGKMIA